MSNKFIKKPYSGKINNDYTTYLFNTGDLSDVTLVLKDGTDSCSIKLHRIFLHRIPYFDMLIRNMKDNTLEIAIPHIEVTKKIIARCYNIPMRLDDVEKLWYVKCCSFMCIECDVKILTDLKVDAENYELLHSIASEFEYSNPFIELLAKNLPEDYELDKLPLQVLKRAREIHTVSPIYIFSEIDGQTTDAPTSGINLSSNIKKYPYRFIYPDIISIKPGQKIIISHDATMAALYDDELVKFSHDDKYLLVRISLNEMIVKDIANDKITGKLRFTTPIKDFTKSDDDIYIITPAESNLIYIIKINLVTNLRVKFPTEYQDSDDVRIIRCSDGKLIVHDDSKLSMIQIRDQGMWPKDKGHFPDSKAIKIISNDHPYFAYYHKKINKLIIYEISDHLEWGITCNVYFDFPALIYFSGEHIIFQNSNQNHQIKIREFGEGSIIRYHNFPSKLTDRIDDVVNS